MENPNPQPLEELPLWDTLGTLLASADADGIREFLATLIPAEIPRLLGRLEHDDQALLFGILTPAHSASLLEQLPDFQIADLLSELEPRIAAEIMNALRSNAQADVLTELGDEKAAAVLKLMLPEEAADAKRLIQYPEGTAGSIMITEYLSFPESVTVGGVVDELRANTDKYQRHDVQYIYITNARRVLKGVLRLRDLVLTKPSVPVHQIMIPEMDTVQASATIGELQDFFASRPYRGVPVIDASRRLVGVVRHADVAEALGEQAASDHLKAQGIIGGEEVRTMPVFTRAWHRLSWLSINIVLNILAASIIAIYQDTLSAVIVLAVFLPIISDMSGCSGNQAIAVSMRELTLGIIQPADVMRVWGKELSVGLINALALGFLLGLAAFAWKGNVILSLVVGLALALNTVVAVSLGGLVPLLLRALRLDPALASGPILTTVTDMCGFFLVLSFATAALPSLG